MLTQIKKITTKMQNLTQKSSFNLGKKTLDQHFGANLKNLFILQKFSPNLLLFCIFFSFLVQKLLKIKILTNAWGEQHQNAGRNIQHLVYLIK